VSELRGAKLAINSIASDVTLRAPSWSEVPTRYSRAARVRARALGPSWYDRE
jgi:hypothetical protein